MPTRRHFLTTATATLIATRTHAQSRPDIPSIERDRILTQAKLPTTPQTLPDLSATIANQTAAFLLTKDPTYATRTQPLLEDLLHHPAQPENPQAETLVPIAEIAVAIRHLTDIAETIPALTSTLTKANLWLTTLQLFLTDSRDLRIQRDLHDHRATCWLLLSACIARGQRDEKSLDEARHRFKNPTLRNQLTADGAFPQEMATPNPYRNTLFNFDLLAATAQILSASLGGIPDDLFNYQLPDGPGVRSAAAFLYPVIRDRARWPAVSDANNFRDLPGRRPALLFTGRAYNRPEYIDLYRTLPPTIPPALAATFPIREPLLWTTRPPHGL